MVDELAKTSRVSGREASRWSTLRAQSHRPGGHAKIVELISMHTDGAALIFCGTEKRSVSSGDQAPSSQYASTGTQGNSSRILGIIF